LKAKAVTTLAVTAVCLAIAGGVAVEHRGSGSPDRGPVVSQTQGAPVWQIDGGGVTPAPGASHDLFDAPPAYAP